MPLASFGPSAVAGMELEAISAVNAIVRNRYMFAAMLTVQTWDWLLTLDRERELIHPAPFVRTNMNYVVCRYYPFLATALVSWSWLDDHTEHVCDTLIHFAYIAMVLFQVFPQIVFVRRAHAMVSESRMLLYGLWIVLAAIVGFQFYIYIVELRVLTSVFKVLGESGCFGDAQDVNSGTVKSSYYIGTTSLLPFCFDCLITILLVLGCKKQGALDVPIGRLLFNQGIMYFILVSCLNLLSAIMYFAPDPSLHGTGVIFATYLSPILACRLILDLKTKAYPSEEKVARDISHMIHQAFEMDTVTTTERLDTPPMRGYRFAPTSPIPTSQSSTGPPYLDRVP